MDPQDPHFLFPGVPYHLPFAITDRYQEVRMVYQVAVLLGIVLWIGLAPYRQLLCAVFQQLLQPLPAAHVPPRAMAGGRRLSARRKQLRLTQEEVAELADMTTQTISTAENGIKALRPVNIIKLCGALKISADYLLFGTISNDDQSILFSKVSQLSPEQYRHLEDIINSFIAAVIPNDESEV